jgi:hypothetical protein
LREVPPFLREHGFEIGDGTFKKLTLPSRGKGPPFKWWGPFKVFGDATTLEWAKTNLRTEKKPFGSADRKEEEAST